VGGEWISLLTASLPARQFVRHILAHSNASFQLAACSF